MEGWGKNLNQFGAKSDFLRIFNDLLVIYNRLERAYGAQPCAPSARHREFASRIKHWF